MPASLTWARNALTVSGPCSSNPTGGNMPTRTDTGAPSAGPVRPTAGLAAAPLPTLASLTTLRSLLAGRQALPLGRVVWFYRRSDSQACTSPTRSTSVTCPSLSRSRALAQGIWAASHWPFPKGNELVLPAVQQQHGNGDIGQQRQPSNVPACRSQYE